MADGTDAVVSSQSDTRSLSSPYVKIQPPKTDDRGVQSFEEGDGNSGGDVAHVRDVVTLL